MRLKCMHVFSLSLYSPLFSFVYILFCSHSIHWLTVCSHTAKWEKTHHTMRRWMHNWKSQWKIWFVQPAEFRLYASFDVNVCATFLLLSMDVVVVVCEQRAHIIECLECVRECMCVIHAIAAMTFTYFDSWHVTPRMASIYLFRLDTEHCLFIHFSDYSTTLKD